MQTKTLKKHLSISDQVSLLENRGLIIVDRSEAESFLEHVNYYRFSGYLHDFKIKKSNQYEKGLSFSTIARIYEFDMKLTRLLMYVLEDIEETLKTRFAYTLSSAYPDNPLIYMEENIYKDETELNRFKSMFKTAINNNKGLPFIKHHIDVYGGEFPVWVAVEIMTMGNIRALYDNLQNLLKKEIARKYNTGSIQLANWIQNLTYTRNHLAHYMRIYNYRFGRIPKSCKQHPIKAVYRGKIFDQIAVMSFMYSRTQDWNTYVLKELDIILSQYNDVVDLSSIGFPEDWESVLKF